MATARPHAHVAQHPTFRRRALPLPQALPRATTTATVIAAPPVAATTTAPTAATTTPTVYDASLVGRRVMATYEDEDGETQWYPATIVHRLSRH